MRTLLIALAMLFAPSPQIKDGALLEGFVVKTSTSEPVARARVVLNKDGGPPSSMSATTDGGGKFSFQNVEPGRYRLSVTRDGYVRAEYGQNAPAYAGTVITLAAKQEMKDVRISLTPTGAIAGRIYDKYGDPVGNANVQALKYAYQDGRRVLTVVQSVRTNDLGEYRMFWMQPGKYIVSAVSSGRPDGIMNFDLPPQIAGAVGGTIRLAGNLTTMGIDLSSLSSSAADSNETPLTVYYPGTTDAAGAGAIELRPGANYTGVDLSVVDARAVKIRGRVISNRSGAVGASVSLVPKATVAGNGQLQRTASVNERGEFEFKGIAPGAYDLIATSGRQFFSFSDSSSSSGVQTTTRQAFVFTTPNAAGSPIDPHSMTAPSGSEPRLFGRVPLDVGSADIDNVSIQLQQGFSVNGRIALDGPALQGGDPMANMRVTLRPDPMIPQLSSIPAQVSANGSFTVTDLMPGDYRINVSGLPRGGYLKSAGLPGTDASNLLLHVDGEPAGGLEILVGTNPGTVDATIQSEKQEAVTGVTVVLVPTGAGRRQRSELYRTATSDAAGRIHLDAVIPGDYKLFAWENVEPGSWQDPDFLRTYEDRGKAVHITEGGRETADVRVIPYR